MEMFETVDCYNFLRDILDDREITPMHEPMPATIQMQISMLEPAAITRKPASMSAHAPVATINTKTFWNCRSMFS
jgi:hypothetical protein